MKKRSTRTSPAAEKPARKAAREQEELQSSNEELVTLNEQLQNRNAELAHLNDDLSNILAAVNIPILILDPDRRIWRFTPPAEKLMRLLPGDIGRPIGGLRIGISIPDMDKLIASVIEKESAAQQEAQGEDGRWYLLSVRPFKTGERKIKGVLIALVDIQELKQHEAALRKEHEFNTAILNAARGLLVVVLDAEGRIVRFSHACEKLTGYSFAEVKGRKVWDFLLVPEEVAGVKAAFESLWSGLPNRYLNHWVAKDGRRLLLDWSNAASMADGAVKYVIKTGVDRSGREQAEQRSKESESTVHALLETATQAILAVDRQGRIVLANAAAEKMFGYSRAELIGSPIETLVPRRFAAGHGGHLANWFANPMNRPMGRGIELSCLRKDGSEFPSEISLSSVWSHNGVLGVAFVTNITERRATETMIRNYRYQLQALTANLLSRMEAGNRELARELHDNFSQQLAGLGMEASALQASAESGQDLHERLQEFGRKLHRLGDEIHSTSRRLHPAILEDLGLEAALREECRSFEEHSRIPVDLAAENIPASVPRDVSLCLYRVAQESLRNIAKHSQAAHVHVRLTGGAGPNGGDGITLSVEDEGDGFDLDRALKKGGLGLISMEERIRLVGGKLTIQSKPGEGTTVTGFVPLPPVSTEASAS